MDDGPTWLRYVEVGFIVLVPLASVVLWFWQRGVASGKHEQQFSSLREMVSSGLKSFDTALQNHAKAAQANADLTDEALQSLQQTVTRNFNAVNDDFRRMGDKQDQVIIRIGEVSERVARLEGAQDRWDGARERRHT